MLAEKLQAENAAEIRYPKISEGDPKRQTEDIKRYLYTLAETLQVRYPDSKIRYPSISAPTVRGQIHEIKRYLYVLVEKLQWVTNNII